MIKQSVPLLLLLVLLVACSPATVTPMPTATVPPSPTGAPSPTPVPPPTPTPSPTPLSPIALTIPWPSEVSALHPVTVSASLLLPAGAVVTPTVRATVLDGNGEPFWVGRLWPQGGGRYAAYQPLQLPLRPVGGDWRLKMYVQSILPVTGTAELRFRPQSPAFRVLTDTLHPGAALAVPQAFTEVLAQGDTWAGARVWRYGGGEIGLWWAPGPTEPLLRNNAVVMVEATLDAESSPRLPGGAGSTPSTMTAGTWAAGAVPSLPTSSADADNPPRLLEIEETEWKGHTAFFFRERWPGTDGGPAEGWVVQGGDYWLYVLRLRAVGGTEIPTLMRLVGDTFTLTEK